MTDEIIIGQEIYLKSETLYREDAQHRRLPMDGKVVYIHPENRFYSVEFDVHGYKIRESFFFSGRQGVM